MVSELERQRVSENERQRDGGWVRDCRRKMRKLYLVNGRERV